MEGRQDVVASITGTKCSPGNTEVLRRVDHPRSRISPTQITLRIEILERDGPWWKLRTEDLRLSESDVWRREEGRAPCKVSYDGVEDESRTDTVWTVDESVLRLTKDLPRSKPPEWTSVPGREQLLSGVCSVERRNLRVVPFKDLYGRGVVHEGLRVESERKKEETTRQENKERGVTGGTRSPL